MIFLAFYKFQVALTKLKFLPQSGGNLSRDELIVARDVLEIGAFWSIAKKDIPSFERYMAQLKCYYLDYKWVNRLILYGMIFIKCLHKPHRFFITF